MKIAPLLPRAYIFSLSISPPLVHRGQTFNAFLVFFGDILLTIKR